MRHNSRLVCSTDRDSFRLFGSGYESNESYGSCCGHEQDRMRDRSGDEALSRSEGESHRVRLRRAEKLKVS
jgi:hypothetical protein